MSQTVYSMPRAIATEVQADVELKHVVKLFNDEPAVRELDLRVNQGEFFSILGPSGCGKTTTLRLIAGFETPTSGEVLIQGVNMNRTPAHRRPVNTVFQSYALFDHMSVKDNIAFGLKIKRMPAAQLRERVLEALKLVRMEAFADRLPTQLSGGQQQRVALARALAFEPHLMLLDEPLSALDKKLRAELQTELRELHGRVGLTFVYVTHDQDEALSMSQRVAIMRDGRIVQEGPPKALYDRPATRFVADFLGRSNFIEAKVRSTDGRTAEVEAAGRRFQVMATTAPLRPGETATIALRPEKVMLGAPGSADDGFDGWLVDVSYFGAQALATVEVPGLGRIMATVPGDAGGLASIPGAAVSVRWAADAPTSVAAD